MVLTKDHLFRVLRPFVHYVTDGKRERTIRELCRVLVPDLVLNSSSIVFDLGANRGDFSKYALNQGSSVVAFEPNPIAFRYLHKRLKNYESLTLLRAAVSDKNGVNNFFVHGDSHHDPLGYSIRGSLKKKENNYILGDFKVLTLSFGALLAATPYITCLKIDIEGAEIEIWPSIKENAKKIEYLLVEIHDSLNQELRQEIEEFIAKSDLQGKWTTKWI